MAGHCVFFFNSIIDKVIDCTQKKLNKGDGESGEAVETPEGQKTSDPKHLECDRREGTEGRKQLMAEGRRMRGKDGGDSSNIWSVALLACGPQRFFSLPHLLCGYAAHCECALAFLPTAPPSSCSSRDAC